MALKTSLVLYAPEPPNLRFVGLVSPLAMVSRLMVSCCVLMACGDLRRGRDGLA